MDTSILNIKCYNIINILNLSFLKNSNLTEL